MLFIILTGKATGTRHLRKSGENIRMDREEIRETGLIWFQDRVIEEPS